MLTTDELKLKIAQGEGLHTEFKTASMIHREFYSYFRATLTIYKDTVVAENGNIPYTMGRITLENLKPHTKNPTMFAFG